MVALVEWVGMDGGFGGMVGFDGWKRTKSREAGK